MILQKKKNFSHVQNIDIIVDRASVTHNSLFNIKETLLNSFLVLKPGGYFIGVDWFSTNHSGFKLGRQDGDLCTRNNIEEGRFKNVGLVHFSNESHIRSLFTYFQIISLEEKIVNSYEPNSNYQFASWNIVARKI